MLPRGLHSNHCNYMEIETVRNSILISDTELV
jgi:hypothetical protein